MARIKYYDSTSASWKYADTNITSTGSVELDTTLTQSGRAADAKAVGDAISQISGQNGNATAIDYDQNVKAINHRGYNSVAPENTLPAYILSKQNGFNYAEADVSFTSDGVAVLLHDSTIDRTSDGTGSISSMTYAEALGYDFGSWKSAEYTGTKIPTFEEFILLCKKIMLHPYIELKSNGSYTEAQIQGLVDIVKRHGMAGKVTWISFNATFLGYVATYDDTARLGYLPGSAVTEDAITKATALKTGKNEVFIDADNLYLKEDGIQRCIDAGLPLEIWTVNTTAKITGMNPYVSGVTSDSLIAGKVLYENGMTYTPATVYTVTNNLSNATNSNAQTAIVKNGSYSATLTANSGYTLDTVTVTMGGTNITATAYADGVVSIAFVTGNVIITATAVAESGGGDSGEEPGGETTTGTLIHRWDFTQSLSDSVGGSDAVIVSGGATQSSDGLTIPDATSYVKLCDSLQTGDVVEVDVGACSANLSSAHGRLIMYPDSNTLYNNGGNVATGLIYRNTGYWQQYANVKWSGETVESDANAFANKTIKLVAGDGVYLNSTKIAACALGAGSYTRLGIGSGSTAFHDATITAIRIYRP